MYTTQNKTVFSPKIISHPPKAKNGGSNPTLLTSQPVNQFSGDRWKKSSTTAKKKGKGSLPGKKHTPPKKKGQFPVKPESFQPK